MHVILRGNRVGLLLVSCLVILALMLPKGFGAQRVKSAYAAQDPGYMNEALRPQYHFTPEANWMNDPNGLVYYHGEYHIFYQYNPYSLAWGPMHWGHAVSTDLMHWKPLPIALFPDALGAIWSGSAVIDPAAQSHFAVHDASGNAMVVFYTSAANAGQISLAYSADFGRTWTKYGGNPVIPNTSGNFRDSKVFWNQQTNAWNLVLTVATNVNFYSSTDLKQWHLESTFGSGQGVHGEPWECPDLFQLPVDGNSNTTKWVLAISTGNNGPQGGSGIQYFIGNFDGHSFSNSNGTQSFWMDEGKDAYAGTSFNAGENAANPQGNLQGRRLWLSWMTNLSYSGDPQLPTSPWRGAMTLPHDLKLKTIAGLGIRLTQTAAVEVTNQRQSLMSAGTQTIAPTGSNLLTGVSGDSLEIVAQFTQNNATASTYGFAVRQGNGQQTLVGYTPANATYFVDRSASGNTGFNSAFLGGSNSGQLGRFVSHAIATRNTVTFDIFVDRSSVEVFGNDDISLTNLIFPDPTSVGLSTFATGGSVTLNSLAVYRYLRMAGSSPVVSNVTGWSTLSGLWADTTQGKQGRSPSDGFVVSAQTMQDGTYAADITLTSDPNTQAVGAGALLFRATVDSSGSRLTGGYFANIDVTGQRAKLIRINGDSSFSELQSVPVAVSPNIAYHLAVTATGSSIQVQLNGTTVITATDSSASSGLVGLNVWNTGATFFQHILFTPSNTGFRSNLSNWSAMNGTWTDIAQGRQGSAGGDTFDIAQTTANDFTYQGTVTVNGGGAGALVFRSDATAANAYVVTADAVNHYIKFFKFVNGMATVLQINGTIAIQPDTTYTLKVQAQGSTFTVWLNNTQLFQQNDTSLTSGQLGLNVWNGKATWQDVNVTPANSGFRSNLSNWNALSGTWTDISQGRQGSASSDAFDLAQTTASDFTYQGTVTIDGGGAGALVFRSDAMAANAYVVTVDVVNHYVKFFKFVNGVATVLQTNGTTSIQPDTAYTLKVQAQGNMFTVWLNAVQLFQQNDTSLTSGQLGLNVWNGKATWQDVNVT